MIDPRLRRHALGFLELSSKPDKDSLARYYEEKYFQNESGNYRKSYSPEEFQVIEGRIELRASRARQLISRTAPGRLLDVGCGEGFVLAAFAKERWDVRGIDYSRAGVENMHPHLLHCVDQGDVFALLEEHIALGERYDIVWLGNVLEHVLDPLTLLRQLRSIVDPDGVLVAVVPNDGTYYHEELLADGFVPDRFWIAIPDHISYFTAESLHQTAAETGWVVRDLQGDFPIDFFLSHPGSNYVSDPAKGPEAHAARLRIERLIGRAGEKVANEFYSALAAVGFGRNLVAFMTPDSEHHNDD